MSASPVSLPLSFFFSFVFFSHQHLAVLSALATSIRREAYEKGAGILNPVPAYVTRLGFAGEQLCLKSPSDSTARMAQPAWKISDQYRLEQYRQSPVECPARPLR